MKVTIKNTTTRPLPIGDGLEVAPHDTACVDESVAAPYIRKRLAVLIEDVQQKQPRASSKTVKARKTGTDTDDAAQSNEPAESEASE